MDGSPEGGDVPAPTTKVNGVVKRGAVDFDSGAVPSSFVLATSGKTAR